MAAHLEIWQAADGWRWHCRAANGELVAQGEAHTTRADAERAARTAAELMGQAVDEHWPAPLDEDQQ